MTLYVRTTFIYQILGIIMYVNYIHIFTNPASQIHNSTQHWNRIQSRKCVLPYFSTKVHSLTNSHRKLCFLTRYLRSVYGLNVLRIFVDSCAALRQVQFKLVIAGGTGGQAPGRAGSSRIHPVETARAGSATGTCKKAPKLYLISVQ